MNGMIGDVIQWFVPSLGLILKCWQPLLYWMLIAVQNKLTAWFGKRQTGIYIAGHLIELAGSI